MSSRAPHGTETRYKAGCRCAACRAAATKARRARDQRRRDRLAQEELAVELERVRAIAPDASKAVCELGEEDAALFDRFAALDRQLKQVERERAKAELALKQRMAGAVALRAHGRIVATWRGFDATVFDQERFRQDHPQLAARYTRKAPHRRFLLAGRSAWPFNRKRGAK